MVSFPDIQTAYYMVAATGVLVAAIYYVYNMRATRKTQELALKSQELIIKSQEQTLETRQAQLFMGINAFSYSNDWFSAYTKLITMDLKTAEDFDEMFHNPEKIRAFHMVGGWLEGIGVLVKEKLVDVRLVTLLISGVTLWYWQSYGEFICKVRKERNFPRYMIEVEYLAKVVREYGESHSELGVESNPAEELYADLKSGK